MRKSLLAAAVLCFVFSSLAEGAHIIYVNASTGSDQFPGTSWQQPKKTIMAAVAVVPANGQVWVARGLYKEQVSINKSISLYGGFAGNETLVDQRAPFPRMEDDPNAGIIDGSYVRSCVVISNSDARIDGFTIRNGRAESHNSNCGGGISCWNVNAIIANNTIVGNFAAVGGGGVYGREKELTIINNRIAGNSAQTGGGGIHGDSGCRLIIKKNKITGNMAPSLYGASGVHVSNGQCIMSHNHIIANGKEGNTTNGGGIFIGGPDSVVSCNIIAKNYNCGIYIYQEATITNNTIAGHCEADSMAHAIIGYGAKQIYNNIIAFNSIGPSSLGFNNCLYNLAKDEIPSNGNFRADPKLVSVLDDNYHLMPDSVCRDRAYSSTPGITEDIDGQPRLIGSGIDLGADETDGQAWVKGFDVAVKVSTTGSDNNDGLSWKRAIKSISVANKYTGYNRQIWVAKGTYDGISLSYISNIQFYGGFTGNEINLSQRPPFPRASDDPNNTILSYPNHYNYLSTSNTTSSRVDGFTFAKPGVWSVHDCKDITLVNNTMNGVMLDIMRSQGSIVGNTFLGIEEGKNNFGINCVESSLSIRNNELLDCIGFSKAGIFVDKTSVCSIEHNLISGCSSRDFCGVETTNSPNCVIRGNQVENNTAKTCGIRVSGSALVERNIVRNNTGLSGEAGIIDANPRNGGVVNIIGNLITGNTGTYCCIANNGLLTGNTIAYNRRNTSSPANAIVMTRLASVYGNVIAFNDKGIQYQYMKYSRNCVYGNRLGNYYPSRPANCDDINMDPVFADADNGDFSIRAASPCVNAFPMDAALLPPFDLNGNPRGVYGPDDIGAFECVSAAYGIKEAKMAAQKVPTTLENAVVTASFPDFFYVETEDRCAGIRVNWPNNTMQVGYRVDVDGVIGFQDTAEKCIHAYDVNGEIDSISIKPLFVTNRALGGNDFFYLGYTGYGLRGTKAWQWVKSGETSIRESKNVSGLNNLGLLVSIAGKVTWAQGNTFYVDDGSGFDDFQIIDPTQGAHSGVKVLMPSDEWLPTVGALVKVTGVSSAAPNRIIRARGADDVTMIINQGP